MAAVCGKLCSCKLEFVLASSRMMKAACSRTPAVCCLTANVCGAGVAAGFEGGLKNSKTDEAAGTTLLLGFRAAEFSVVYPEDTSKACMIKAWEAGVPLNSVIKAAAASSSTGQVQQPISKLMVAIYDSSDEDLVSAPLL